VACRRDNVTADAAGWPGIFPLDLPELLHYRILPIQKLS
jgi:hypothetical protein